MSYRIPAELIAAENGKHAGRAGSGLRGAGANAQAARRRYRGDRQASRGLRGRSSDLGRRHRRNALCALSRAGEPRDVFDKLEDCATIQQLTRATPTVSPHFPWDKVSDYGELRQRAEESGPWLRCGQFQHLSGPGRAETRATNSAHSPTPTRRFAPQAIAHNLECIEIGQKLGSKALTIWIADGTQFRRPIESHRCLRPLSRVGIGDLRRAARGLAGFSRAQAL